MADLSFTSSTSKVCRTYSPFLAMIAVVAGPNSVNLSNNAAELFLKTEQLKQTHFQ